MPESIVLRQGTLNPYRGFMRRQLANHLADRVNSSLAGIINGVEHTAGTLDYKPIDSEEIVTYVMTHSRHSRNAAPLVVEVMPGDSYGRRGRQFMISLRRQIELLVDAHREQNPNAYRAAGVEGVEVCISFKNSTGSTYTDGQRGKPWGEPKAA